MVEEKEELQEALNNLCKWADRWGMEFNVINCKDMHFGCSNPRCDYYERNSEGKNR